MSRALFITCALLAGAVVWFHATAPDCAGWYCLALGDKPAAKQKTQSSSLPAASRQAGGDKPRLSNTGQAIFASPDFNDEAAPLDQAALEPEAEAAPADRWNRPAAAFDGVPGADPAAREDEEAETPARRIAAKKAARKAANAWEALVTTALEEPDPEKRGLAIGDVGLHRNDDAVAVLLEVAAFEAYPENRYQALQSLWYSAADGLDAEGSIWSALQAARNDPDEQIAELAEKAIADLTALEAAD